ncbi:MAG TPA: nickel-dependent hydrogenase large subunit, partial [Rhodocyclaceae bacterium]|nr:nickel-dependent hydrogenase large subunit [Rhodocyclaceae bacterium]
LASPDLLFGFDAPAQQRNIIAVAAAHPDIATHGILLRKFGQEVIRITAGKRIHGTGAIPGGVNKSLSPAERDELLRDADTMIDWSRDAVALARRLHESDADLYDHFGEVPGQFLSLVRPDGALDLYDGVLRLRGADGRVVRDGIPCTDYLGHITEAVRPWSYMKFPYITTQGPDTGWYKVGPLARVQNCDLIPTPRAEAARQAFLAHGGGAPLHGPLAFHWARMIEMLHAAEVIRELLDDPDLLSDDRMSGGPRRREGIGIIEAPRGTLIHHYQVDDDDLVSDCNLIVSTTHNNQAMNTAVRAVARRYLDGQTLTEGLLNHIEVAIRAFDPCLSCATHALGKMPLALELRNVAGALVDRLQRDA